MIKNAFWCDSGFKQCQLDVMQLAMFKITVVIKFRRAKYRRIYYLKIAIWRTLIFQVWNLTNCKLKTNHIGHTGYLNCVTVSPDGSLCASGGKDCRAMLWDLNEGKHLYTLEGGDIINSLCFSPNRYWLCAATGPSIKIWVRLSKPRDKPCSLLVQ